MIGSFWNLCRACPSMPVDKLHSEYRSTYRWHEYTGNQRPEVVRKPPVPNNFGPINEPPLPRRKKCPELAYRTNEFMGGHDTSTEHDTIKPVTRARSEERGTPSRRSKSEGPAGIDNGKGYENQVVDGIGRSSKKAGESNDGLFKKTISKLSTEYRIQFVWPQVRKAIKGQTNDNVDYPRKSLSMNAIKSQQSNVLPTVHKKRTTKEKEATLFELEPLVNDGESGKGGISFPVTHKKASTMEQDRPSQFITKKENFGFGDESCDYKKMNGIGPNENWYKEVIEARKKAGEYKCRGWGIEIDPDLYKKQKDLWDQVSKRSSLSALSLASSIHSRPITKEEKDEENNKKTFQDKPDGKMKVPGQAYQVDNKIIQDGRAFPMRIQTIRHHLERTTGPDVEEGALLPSPTREKLMPVIPKQKDIEHGSQKGSPKKTDASRHGSPQKGSPKKGSPKKTTKGRSQSVGPAAIETNESPKRQIRSISTAPSAAKGAKATGTSTPTATERRPRPSTFPTSIHSRSKSSSLHPSGRASSASDSHHQNNLQLSQINNNQLNSQTTNTRKVYNSSAKNNNVKQRRPKSAILNGLNNNYDQIGNKKLAKNDEDTHDKDTAVSAGSSSPQPVIEPAEHIVKSPPEPTRVKSPEQILMRSPDPVNWTVPLDTGKTFTVTQNVKDGEFYNRPQSEVKASTPIERPPPAPQSAPPELTEQSKMEGDAWADKGFPKHEIIIVNDQEYIIPIESTSEINDAQNNHGSTINQVPKYQQAAATITSNVIEMAQNRFDRYWGASKEETY